MKFGRVCALSVVCWVTVLSCVSCGTSDADEHFPLAIIHINDFHARFEPTDKNGGTCDPGEVCMGGYARTVHKVRQLLNLHKDKNPVYFNAGDSFQGTLWYNIGRWEVTSEMLNLLPADAMTLGNHEFDHGIAGVVPFLESLKSPMLVANMDARDEPTMQGKYNKSMIIERSGRRIGLIGVILETTDNIANTENLIFTNESIAIKAEAERLVTEEGTNIIIVISHCGYEVDQIIAQNAGPHVDVIVGAHSHTFLYTGKGPGPERPRGDYPTVVIQEATGKKVLVVQAAAYAKYVGDLTVYFNKDGDVVRHEGAPHYMSSDVPEDAEVVSALAPWKEIVDEMGMRVIGENIVTLDKSDCGLRECNLGNFFCDALVHAIAKASPPNSDTWSNATIALANTGALRVPLQKGSLTYSHLVTMSPFENHLTTFSLYGRDLVATLEYSVAKIDVASNTLSAQYFVQVSGLRIVYNVANPVGSRVVSVKALCHACKVPRYEALEEGKVYRIVAPEFLAGGGDGFTMLREKGFDVRKTELRDLDALIEYVTDYTPVYNPVDGRITVTF